LLAGRDTPGDTPDTPDTPDTTRGDETFDPLNRRTSNAQPKSAI